MSCLLSKLEFASWLGVNDPYSFFGIVQDFDGTNPPPIWQVPDQLNCACNLMGDEFDRAIERATSMFLELANWIPIPTYFENDFPFPYPNRGLLSTYLHGKRIDTLRCPIIQYGKRELNIQVEDALVTKTDSGDMLEFFTLPVFQVPNTIQKSQIKVFFTPEDAGYTDLEDCCEYEIKPLRISFTANGDFWDVEISGHAVVFKRPNLEPSDEECLPNVEETYVDEVDIYLEEFDTCDAGYISFDTLPCSTTPCEDDTLPVCFKTYNKRFAEIIFAQCNDDDPPVMRRYNSCQIIGDIRNVHINWQAGLPFENCNLYGYQHHTLINTNDREIISLLALHFLDECINAWCECEFCVKKNLKAWRRVQYILHPNDTLDGQLDPLDWISANPYGLNQIPTKALLLATTKITLKNSKHLVC